MRPLGDFLAGGDLGQLAEETDLTEGNVARSEAMGLLDAVDGQRDLLSRGLVGDELCLGVLFQGDSGAVRLVQAILLFISLFAAFSAVISLTKGKSSPT